MSGAALARRSLRAGMLAFALAMVAACAPTPDPDAKCFDEREGTEHAPPCKWYETLGHFDRGGHFTPAPTPTPSLVMRPGGGGVMLLALLVLPIAAAVAALRLRLREPANEAVDVTVGGAAVVSVIALVGVLLLSDRTDAPASVVLSEATAYFVVMSPSLALGWFGLVRCLRALRGRGPFTAYSGVVALALALAWLVGVLWALAQPGHGPI